MRPAEQVPPPAESPQELTTDGSPPRPAAWWVPPALVLCGLGIFLLLPARDTLQRGLLWGFVVVPAAVLFLSGYGAGYLMLRARQLTGRWPQSGVWIVSGGVLTGLLCLVGMLGLLKAGAKPPR